MALSADVVQVYEIGGMNTYPVKASSTIYKGAAVGLSSGYARGLVAGDAFVGFADALADNSATATDGYINVDVKSSGIIKLTITSVAITDVGSPVYASADGTFTLTKGSNSFIGNVYRYVTTNTAMVAFLAQGLPAGELAAGAALASAYILVGNGSGVAAARAVSGDVTITNSGVVAIGTDKILSAMISAGEVNATHISIASGKVHVGNASGIATARDLSGHVTINNSGAVTIANGVVTETMLVSGTLSGLISYAKSFVTSHVLSSAH